MMLEGKGYEVDGGRELVGARRLKGLVARKETAEGNVLQGKKKKGRNKG